MARHPNNWTRRGAWLHAFTFSGPLVLILGVFWKAAQPTAFAPHQWSLVAVALYPLLAIALYFPCRRLTRRTRPTDAQEMSPSDISRMFRNANIILLAFTVARLLSLIAFVPKPIIVFVVVVGALTALFVILCSLWHNFLIEADRLMSARVIFALLSLSLFVAMYFHRLLHTAS